MSKMRDPSPTQQQTPAHHNHNRSRRRPWRSPPGGPSILEGGSGPDDGGDRLVGVDLVYQHRPERLAVDLRAAAGDEEREGADGGEEDEVAVDERDRLGVARRDERLDEVLDDEVAEA